MESNGFNEIFHSRVRFIEIFEDMKNYELLLNPMNLSPPS